MKKPLPPAAVRYVAKAPKRLMHEAVGDTKTLVRSAGAMPKVWGPLKYLIVTPDFHHWHHSSEAIAIDKNYAAHYAFLDWIFGTAIRGQKGFPSAYGVVGDYMPDGFLRQQAFPFTSTRATDAD